MNALLRAYRYADIKPQNYGKVWGYFYAPSQTIKRAQPDPKAGRSLRDPGRSLRELLGLAA